MPPPVNWTTKTFNDMLDGADNGCLEWGGCKDSAGYGLVRVAGKLKKTHRFAWELSRGPIPDGLFVCHRCDNRPCCNVAHLFLGTNQDNIDDREAKGRNRVRRGEANNKAKLTAAMVVRIRELRAVGVTLPSLARQFGVSATAVDYIVKRRNWAHIP